MLSKDQIAEIAKNREAAISRLQPLRREHTDRAISLYKDGKNILTNLKQENEIKTNIGVIPGFYPTPRPLAARMVKTAGLLSGRYEDPKVLEPSAGSGNIAEEIRAAGVEPLCIEINWTLAEALRKKNFDTVCNDFMEWGKEAGEGRTFDVVLMNPPFENMQDIDHVYKAYSLLNPGGVIVAIMSAGTEYRSNKKTREFREWLSDIGSIERLPPGSFKESRTNVDAVYVVIDK
jgi:predicted RNA methylase